ncbi:MULTISPECIES: cyclophilin-like fold protein [unclassified Guyparkeria]|uniref:cyclophilin-like fold protein n=1 Tax=unclassified Guyparkeria TaxID=2626246 RepID=UPI00073361AD|nr:MULTISPECIES: cyclophilin-like fold protein [unclassified Guyparkeria]KTG17190.1 hypothetical protein AUR63_10030 [Guyparkeria sp. XI15]OAE87160.1 hypothetical protein AWR35_10045 [Guyparkeria sp. WRN-7]
MIHIHLSAAGERLEARLDDTAAGRDFARLLPIELTLTDFHATEKVADLPRRLDTTNAPDRYAAQVGDITYYAPWGNLAIFYRPFPAARGLVRLGEIEGSIDALRQDGEIPVRIERAEE